MRRRAKQPDSESDSGTAGLPRRRSALSRNFLLVGAGLGTIGAGSLILLAIASRALTDEGFAAFGVWFSLVNLVAFGLFSPLETAVSRSMLETGGLTFAMKRQAALYGGVVFLAVLALCVALQSIVVPRLMDDSWAVVAVTLVYILLLAVQAFQRGVAVGYSQYRPLFWQFTSDGVLRVGLALVAVQLGSSSLLAFASCVALSATIGIAIAFATIRSRTAADLITISSGIGGRALASLIVAAVGAQVLANGAPPILSMIGRDEAQTLAALVGALTLTRMPLLFTAAIQAPLLPPLVDAIEKGDVGGVWSLIRRIGTVLLTAGLVAALLGWRFGEETLQAFLGADNAAGPVALGLLASSGVALLATLAMQAALVAAAAHRALVSAWLAGVAVFAITTAYNGSAIVVAPLAISLGTLTTLLLMLLGLHIKLRTRKPAADPASSTVR